MNRNLCVQGIRLFFCVVAVAAAGGVEASPDRQYAITAPLAAQSLLLDGTAFGRQLIVVGERGHILVSADSGATWDQAAVPTRATLTAVDFADGQRGCAVGHDETIVCTYDGARTWTRVHTAPEEERPLLTILFLNETRGLAAGAYGAFMQTDDGGQTWHHRDIGEGDLHLNHLSRAPSGQLYLAAEAGFLFRSNDDGEHWQELPSPYTGSFFGMLPLADRIVLAFGLRGHLFRSDDAGDSWQQLDTGVVELLGHGTMLDDGTVMVSGLGGTVLASTDGGRSFVLSRLSDRRGITAVLQAGDGRLIRVGEGGVEPLRLPRPEEKTREAGNTPTVTRNMP